MIREYMDAAIAKAEFEILPDDDSWYGEIPGFQGVYSNAETLEECRRVLEEVLEVWLLYRISRQLETPIVDGLDLRIRETV